MAQIWKMLKNLILGGTDSETEQRSTPIVVHPTLPKQLKSLHADLLGDYAIPPFPPTDARPPSKIQDLSLSEKASLEHYIAWKKSNGTVKGYQYHATVLQSNLDTEILSLHQVKKLSQRLTGFDAKKWTCVQKVALLILVITKTWINVHIFPIKQRSHVEWHTTKKAGN